MTDIDNTAFQTLVRQYPNALVTEVEQPVSEADFQAQKTKHLSRQALGGAIGIITNPDGHIVLMERSGMHAGWSLPGGTVEKGEDFAVAFKREALEEIGVVVHSVRASTIERKKFVSPTGETLDFVLAVFAGKIRERTLPEPTADAIAEGLTAAFFAPYALPEKMALGDRGKVEAFAQETQSNLTLLATIIATRYGL